MSPSFILKNLFASALNSPGMRLPALVGCVAPFGWCQISFMAEGLHAGHRDGWQIFISIDLGSTQIPRFTWPIWGPPGAHLGPVGPRWAPCWSHEPCYQGRFQNYAPSHEAIFPASRFTDRFAEIYPHVSSTQNEDNNDDNVADDDHMMMICMIRWWWWWWFKCPVFEHGGVYTYFKIYFQKNVASLNVYPIRQWRW